jgi:hypothetical protein
MKRFIHWLKQISQRRSAVDKSMGEGDPDRPFGWFGDDQADSSIFITGSLTTKKSETKASDEAPGSGYTTLCDAENDEDFDPYNSGRFNSK